MEMTEEDVGSQAGGEREVPPQSDREPQTEELDAPIASAPLETPYQRLFRQKTLCLLCQSKAKFKTHRFDDLFYCEECIRIELSRRAEGLKAEYKVRKRVAKKFVKRMAQLDRYFSDLAQLQYQPIRFNTPSAHSILKRKIGMKGKVRVDRSPIPELAEIFRIEKIDSYWMYCQNRAQNADLEKYWKLLEGEYEEEGEVQAEVDEVVSR